MFYLFLEMIKIDEHMKHMFQLGWNHYKYPENTMAWHNDWKRMRKLLFLDADKEP